MQLVLILLLNLLAVFSTASGSDYVRLRSGRLVEGAVIRQDTLAVFLAPWEQRYLRQPEVQVFARDEVESIWLGQKPNAGSVRKFVPHERQMELGGGLAFQTWASTVHQRRYLIQVSSQFGTQITKNLGTEVVADFSLPFGNSKDKSYDSLKFAVNVAFHIVGSLQTKSPWVPFAFIGAGIGQDVPRNGVIVTTSGDERNLVEFGLGLKTGFNGAALRVELKHAYYQWGKNRYVGSVNGEDLYTTRQSADATSLRVSLFTYFDW